MLKHFLLLLSILSYSSCASRHERMRGSVALKINETSGVVCLEPNKARIGEKLNIYNNHCTKLVKGTNCELVIAGEAEITKILNDHYSEFKTISNTRFEEGSIIKPKE